MKTNLRDKIINQIQEADEVILLEIQELLKLQNHDSNKVDMPLYIKQRLEKSIQQSNDAILIDHDVVMKKYIE